MQGACECSRWELPKSRRDTPRLSRPHRWRPEGPSRSPAEKGISLLTRSLREALPDGCRVHALKVRGVVGTPLSRPAGHGGIGAQGPRARHAAGRIEVGIVFGGDDSFRRDALFDPEFQSRLQVVLRVSLVEAVLAETVRPGAVLAVLHAGRKKQANKGRPEDLTGIR